ncbi:hypothetical protein Cycma_0468 [Cyclobacterium marinum DSM 745]|uniref:Uncharacterized protein n=1 Tax=Cyclobacterium marinum (strain ATCC 25205 / DSM 745 / LMG 13164 / NCIMB 1802) TaxID=880070 RepID=G0IWQ4_CYCMS|nr:hypothetical protein Cycma_0468 [Cyclobacterium marinum DSM 745]
MVNYTKLFRNYSRKTNYSFNFGGQFNQLRIRSLESLLHLIEYNYLK